MHFCLALVRFVADAPFTFISHMTARVWLRQNVHLHGVARAAKHGAMWMKLRMVPGFSITPRSNSNTKSERLPIYVECISTHDGVRDTDLIASTGTNGSLLSAHAHACA